MSETARPDRRSDALQYDSSSGEGQESQDDQAPGGGGGDGFAVGGAVDVGLVVSATAVAATAWTVGLATAGGFFACTAAIATFVAVLKAGDTVLVAVAAAVPAV